MKKWSEIKQATLYKLFLGEEEAQQQGYLEKFQYLANECLNFIANGVKPRITSYSFQVENEKDVLKGEGFVYDAINETIIDRHGNEYIYDENKIYLDLLIGKKLKIKNNVFFEPENIFITNEHILMPDDFLSFYDVVNYVNGEKNPKITYLTDKTIKLKEKGNYTIFYNALWKDIDKNDIDRDNELDIDYSVLNCLPSYIASQVLAQDDIQRATILKNEFELLLSRLDTNVLYEQNHYVSEGGWY